MRVDKSGAPEPGPMPIPEVADLLLHFKGPGSKIAKRRLESLFGGNLQSSYLIAQRYFGRVPVQRLRQICQKRAG